MELVLYFTLLLVLLIPVFIFCTSRSPKRVPPGSLGLPLIGQSLSLMKAMRANKGKEWFEDRIRKNGPISKLSLFGYPTVLLQGQAANKFIYTCDGSILANKQPTPISRILGVNNILELSGDDHKRVRAAILSFLKPAVLKQYVEKLDQEIRHHLDMHWHGKEEVMVMPVMKTLTFNVSCVLLFGVERGTKMDQLLLLFNDMMKALLSIPVNFPWTQFNRGLHARRKLKSIIIDLISEKRAALEKQGVSPHQDLITYLLSIRNEDNSNIMSDKEIVDNIVVLMIAAYDTTSILLTFMVKLLADNQSVYSSVLCEQEEIAKRKTPGDRLTWDDLTKMKYTWSVATETLRMTPPVLFSFRRALKEIEYRGYIIPKGWQVAVVTSMTHMEESIFPHPSTFNPTRFEKQAPAPPFSFVAFGGGPRMCPGFEFAKMETLAMIHHLVTRFTWRLSLKENAFRREPMPVFPEGLPVQIVPKGSTELI